MTEISSKGIDVLVVDDQELVRRMIDRVLERRGYHPVSTSCCEEAYAACANTRYKLAIIDILVGEENGLALGKQLRKRGSVQTVLYISGGCIPPDVLSPGEHYLPKPFDVHDLSSSIDRILGQE